MNVIHELLGQVHQILLHDPDKTGAELAPLIRKIFEDKINARSSYTHVAILDLDVGKMHLSVDINLSAPATEGDADEREYRIRQVLHLLSESIEKDIAYLNFITSWLRTRERLDW